MLQPSQASGRARSASSTGRTPPRAHTIATSSGSVQQVAQACRPLPRAAADLHAAVEHEARREQQRRSRPIPIAPRKPPARRACGGLWRSRRSRGPVAVRSGARSIWRSAAAPAVRRAPRAGRAAAAAGSAARRTRRPAAGARARCRTRRGTATSATPRSNANTLPTVERQQPERGQPQRVRWSRTRPATSPATRRGPRPRSAAPGPAGARRAAQREARGVAAGLDGVTTSAETR